MVKDAEKFADEDKRKREEAEIRNKADSLIYQTEKSLHDFGEHVPADLRQNVERALEELRDSRDSNDLDRIKKATDDLILASQKMAEVMYAQARSENDAKNQGGASSPPFGGSGDSKPEGDAVDADYKEV
jgi:molecular chaperone DnaK